MPEPVGGGDHLADEHADDRADVGAEIDTQLFPGGSLIAQFWSLTWRQARDGIVARGIPGEVIDRGRAALDDSTRWFHGPAKVIAWGRRR